MNGKDREIPFWAYQVGHSNLYKIDYVYKIRESDLYHVRMHINCRRYPDENDLVTIYSEDYNMAIAEHMMEEFKEIDEMPAKSKRNCIRNIFKGDITHKKPTYK